MSNKPVTSVESRFADALKEDGSRRQTFGMAVMGLLQEFADTEAKLYALEDQREDEQLRLQQHEQWTPKVEALTHFLSANADGLNLGRNTLDVALEMLTAARADKVYSANTIYHIGTDENGKVIGHGTRSTSDAHKDLHVMHAALELSQAYELRGVSFPERQIGGLLVRPANEKPKAGAVAPVAPPNELTVTAKALFQVLNALAGPGHHIRELQATKSLPGSPITTLTHEYNTWIEAQVAQGSAV